MMRATPIVILFLLLGTTLFAQERTVIVPPGAPKPIGPYSPGILVRDFLYVSGQGVRDAANNIPVGINAQARQCLDNVKAVVQAAGLSLEHIVHLQVYLEQLSDMEEVDRVFAEYFPTHPPARIVIGVARMPTDTTIELTAVAVRNLKSKKVLRLKSMPATGHASSAIQVGNRIYFSGVYGKSPGEAEALMKKILAEARVRVPNILLSNYYSTAPSALIPVRELPNQMDAAYSVIGSTKDITRLVSDTGSCARDGNTVYCSVQVGNDGASLTVAEQVRSLMQKLFAGLESHRANLSMVVSSNVYLDDIRDFRQMNETYATFFRIAPPTRTTVQPFLPADRSQGQPALVRISVTAVR